ncbi:MAG: hypothetical protein ACLP0J_31100 [Solirubrobacteraceae bacterium]
MYSSTIALSLRIVAVTVNVSPTASVGAARTFGGVPILTVPRGVRASVTRIPACRRIGPLPPAEAGVVVLVSFEGMAETVAAVAVGAAEARSSQRTYSPHSGQK